MHETRHKLESEVFNMQRTLHLKNEELEHSTNVTHTEETKQQ